MKGWEIPRVSLRLPLPICIQTSSFCWTEHITSYTHNPIRTLFPHGASMRKGLVVGLGLLSLMFYGIRYGIRTDAEKGIIEPTVPAIVSEESAESVRAGADPVILPTHEPRVVEPQNQIPPQERMTEEFSKDLAAADAAAREEEKAGTRQPLGWVFGLRAGIAIPTQKVIRDFGNSTSIGPLV